MSTRHDEEFTDYVTGRLPSLRRVAYLLCQDWHQADDLVQVGITNLYAHWDRARAMDHIDAYVRRVVVREFLRERRSGWARRVMLDSDPQDSCAADPGAVWDAAADLRTALARLPRRQRATLVLRFYCDLTTDQAADLLGCSPGTVKSQTAKALGSLRRAPEIGALSTDSTPAGTSWRTSHSEVGTHG
jgi:RNA polymerase sigma-70 factor (sigma-E family)